MPVKILLAFGFVATLATVASMVLAVSFAVGLMVAGLPMGIIAILESASCALQLGTLAVLLYEHLRARTIRRSVVQRRWKMTAVAFGLLFPLYNGLTIATLVWMQIRKADLPESTLGISTSTMLLAAFVVWGISSFAQCSLFMLASDARRVSSELAGFPYADTFDQNNSEMEETSYSVTSASSRGKEIMSSPCSTISSRKRSGSDTMSSVRSSFSNIVRPISSKTRLTTYKYSYRGPSIDSGTGEREIFEEGFDSWDTSAVDPYSWHTVLTKLCPNPAQGRFLETIPASPTTSRSPSPGHPLDLKPLKSRPRSCSHSPANSNRETVIRELTASPTENEAHIHPLFRSDSPTPPPSVTHRTSIIAAPGAGQVISDRRQVYRMRSGTLPSSPSPLVRSNSMEEMRIMSPEREMTPPIPDWILGAESRRSLAGFIRRKGALGEGQQ